MLPFAQTLHNFVYLPCAVVHLDNIHHSTCCGGSSRDNIFAFETSSSWVQGHWCTMLITMHSRVCPITTSAASMLPSNNFLVAMHVQILIKFHELQMDKLAFLAVQKDVTINGLPDNMDLRQRVAAEKGRIAASKTFKQRLFSIKAAHGIIMFVSWINIAGRIFASDQSGDFTCHTYPGRFNEGGASASHVWPCSHASCHSYMQWALQSKPHCILLALCTAVFKAEQQCYSSTSQLSVGCMCAYGVPRHTHASAHIHSDCCCPQCTSQSRPSTSQEATALSSPSCPNVTRLIIDCPGQSWAQLAGVLPCYLAHCSVLHLWVLSGHGGRQGESEYKLLTRCQQHLLQQHCLIWVMGCHSLRRCRAVPE